MDKLLQSEDKTELEELALKLKAVIDTASDGIIIISERGLMQNTNQAVSDLLGYPQEDLIGQNIKMLMEKSYKDQHDQYLQNYLTTGVKKIIGIGREVTAKHKNGTVFPIRLSVSEVKFPDRSVFTGIIHDLTAQKETEKRIKALNASLEKRVEERTIELEEAVSKLLKTNHQLEHEINERHIIEKELRLNRAEIKKALEAEKELGELKSRFISMASHEFRTPLASILSSIELIEAYSQVNPNPKLTKHFQRVKGSVSNLTNILNDFLSLNKLEEGKIQQDPIELDIKSFCEQLLDNLAPSFKTGQEVHFSASPESFMVHHDPKVLQLIISNLLSNASKYSSENTKISLNAIKESSGFQLEVIDQGIGIPQEDQAHLFTRFFRAHNVENIQGTGLGLNIVRHYTELLNGNIKFQSELGQGTTFWVDLPLQSNQNLGH